MVYKEFCSLLSGIFTHSLLAPERPLIWTTIANPKAGGFTIKSRWKKHHAQLAECAKKAQGNKLREANPSKTALKDGGDTRREGLICTTKAGHAAKITADLIIEAGTGLMEAASKNEPMPFYLIVTAGGDGTSLEAMTSLYNAAPEIRDSFAILRLPMGTGNDGSDAWELDKSLDLLIEPSYIVKQRAIRLRTASGKGPFYAFNILSVGLDAFVTHMTNKMKGKLPGDSYKLWVDIASLLYDRIYTVDYMEVRSMDGNGQEVNAFREKILLLAVGESGRRSYGSHKWILPDERNICAMRQMPLFRKLALKGLFAYGTHIDKPEAMLWNAQSVEFSALHPILAQMDGETVLLSGGDYPAAIELTEPAIQILKKRVD